MSVSAVGVSVPANSGECRFVMLTTYWQQNRDKDFSNSGGIPPQLSTNSVAIPLQFQPDGKIQTLEAL